MIRDITELRALFDRVNHLRHSCERLRDPIAMLVRMSQECPQETWSLRSALAYLEKHTNFSDRLDALQELADAIDSAFTLAGFLEQRTVQDCSCEGEPAHVD